MYSAKMLQLKKNNAQLIKKIAENFIQQWEELKPTLKHVKEKHIKELEEESQYLKSIAHEATEIEISSLAPFAMLLNDAEQVEIRGRKVGRFKRATQE